MKRRIILALALLAGVAAQAQRTFVADNADGVELKYEVLSAADQTLSLTANNYTGAIVVPATVSYNDTVWTVTEVGNGAFRERGSVSYVRLPQTVTEMQPYAFYNCLGLDSMRFDMQQPPTVRNVQVVFGAMMRYNSLPLIVPCGTVSTYKRTQWSVFMFIKSDCSVRQTVLVSQDSIVRVDSVVINGRLYNSNGWNEPGDTAWLAVSNFAVLNSGVYSSRKYGYFMGWSNGTTERLQSYVVEGPTTVTAYAFAMPSATLHANNVSTPVYIFSSLGYNGNVTEHRIGNAATIYQTGLWVGSGEHVAATRFFIDGTDYYPGPLRVGSATTDMSTALRYNRVWHVTREMIDYHIAHCGEPGYEPVDDIMTWPGNGDAADGYAEQLAPYYDADGNGHYWAPAGDYPLIRGDECVFSIFNDAMSSHGESGGQPLGIEVHAMTYAFNEPENAPMQNTVFVHYDIYNRSADTYDSTWLGAWTDFDIGVAYDDYIGCDVRRGMYYGYNGEEQDTPGAGSYSGVPPAQSCTFLGAAQLAADGQDNPKIDIDWIRAYGSNALQQMLENYSDGNGGYDTAAITRDALTFFGMDYHTWRFVPGDATGNMAINGCGFGDGIVDNERIGMTNFVYYNNSVSGINSEPQQPTDYYYYMRSVWRNGMHVKFGGDGCNTGVTDLSANFMYPGDSDPWLWGTDGMIPELYANDWTEQAMYNSLGDRRGIGASGPFTFAAGAVQQLDLAYTTAFGTTDVNSSIDMLRVYTDNVRWQWMNDSTASGKPFSYSPYSAPHDVGVARVEDMPRLRLFPNPTTGRMTVVSGPCEVVLMDVTGRVVSAVHSAGRIDLDLSLLPAGIYMLRADGAVRRVVKK